MKDADYWIENLGLIEHPEGGHFREIYRSHEEIGADVLPDRYKGARSFCTSIYYLLKDDEVSSLHRLKSDEVWHFYTGSQLAIHVIRDDGEYSTINLGNDLEKGEVFQAVVTSGCWFGATVNDPGAYSLLGCTVAPGFDYGDFELGDREELVRLYPAHWSIIEKLTKTKGRS